jgi:hypothetical protein
MKACIPFYQKILFLSLEIFRFEVEDIVEIYASKINVKDALEVLGYDNDIHEYLPH